MKSRAGIASCAVLACVLSACAAAPAKPGAAAPATVTKPVAKSKPAELKPAEARPAEASSVEANAAEVKSLEVRSAAAQLAKVGEAAAEAATEVVAGPLRPAGADVAQLTADPVVAAAASELAAPAAAAESAPASPDIWSRIEDGFAMADIEHPLVNRHMKWYLDRPDYMQRMVERSQRYLHFVVEELEKRKLPMELALLPMIESAYNPMAYSRARAAGMWQFIPSTGRNYGLEQDWWADERRDVISSTRAALDYLERIYAMHGDWHLALASYNWGEGAVRRAVQKNRRKGLPTSYTHIHMPAETRGYVPKLQAVKNILGNPGLRAMLELPVIPDEPYFAAIERPEEMDVKLAAEFAEITLEEFVALNPAHNRPILRTDVPLLLPREHVDRFLEKVAAHDRPFISWQKYIFQKDDRIDKVAKRFDVTEQQLRHANGLTGKRAKVMPGQRLMVPLPGEATPETLSVIAALPPFSITDPPPQKKKRYGSRKRTKLAALVPAEGVKAKPKPAASGKPVARKVGAAAKPAAKPKPKPTTGG